MGICLKMVAGHKLTVKENKMNSITELVGISVTAVAAVVILGLLFAYFAMLLWNGCAVPATTVLKEVTWLQMYGIQVLIAILLMTIK